MKSERYKSLYSFFENIIGEKDDEAIDALINCVTVRKCSKKDILIHQGDITETLYFVYSGVIKATYMDENLEDHVLLFSREGEVVLSMEKWDPSCTTACASWECVTACELLSLSFVNAFMLIKKYNSYQNLANRLFVESMIKSQLLLRTRTKSIPERITWFHDTYPELANVVRKQDIASYLGIDKCTYSRVIKKLMLE